MAAIASAFIAGLALYFGWRKERREEQVLERQQRQDELRRQSEEKQAVLRINDVLAWANQAIEALQTLRLLCAVKDPLLDEQMVKQKVADLVFRTSILVEQGRLFFKNELVDDYGTEKPLPYRGYRSAILDPLVVAHQLACAWPVADEDTRLAMQIVSGDWLQRFIYIAQKEVGREQTASDEARKGGVRVDLERLLNEARGIRNLRP
ncbi:hypothetical protein [Shumkonia mesophila]|uniref:hypothetical protein n=1 Tax=Shumkonia mesophila TaxID=2838854 RepID=UPI00293444AC|nr:hypothetical protein [Shumkonia mesophila]